jgi:hypothetical protein
MKATGRVRHSILSSQGFKGRRRLEVRLKAELNSDER